MKSKNFSLRKMTQFLTEQLFRFIHRNPQMRAAINFQNIKAYISRDRAALKAKAPDDFKELIEMLPDKDGIFMQSATDDQGLSILFVSTPTFLAQLDNTHRLVVNGEISVR